MVEAQEVVRSIRTGSTVRVGVGMEDMPDLESGVRKDVRVRVPPDPLVCLHPLGPAWSGHRLVTSEVTGSNPVGGAFQSSIRLDAYPMCQEGHCYTHWKSLHFVWVLWLKGTDNIGR